MELSQAFSELGLDMQHTLPMLLVMLSGLILVVFDAFKPNHNSIPSVTAATLVIAFILAWTNLSGESGTAYHALLRFGGMASFVNLIILGSGLLSVILVQSYLNQIGAGQGEVYALLLFATVGMMVLGSANHLLMTFVGLETMSICLYILTAVVRGNQGSKESALKYFLLGAFSTGFFLYGIALLYGSTGTMYLDRMGSIAVAGNDQVMFWAGVSLLLTGFLFKVSAAPFHMWTPDVYQGAPTPLTGFMSTASKSAAFAALILVLYHAVPTEHWTGVLAIIALITMILGNVVAISQRNVKRMLAYSSVAHAGYILVGLAAGTPEGYSGALFYLVVYSIMNIGAFGVIALLEWDEKEGSEQTLDSLAGVGYKKPLLAWCMVFFMFSLAGFPPLGGFFGKVAVFAPAIDAGLTWLAIAGVLTSAVSAYYYLRVLVVFFMKEPKENESASRSFPVPRLSAAVLVFCVIALIVLGVAPGLLDITNSFFVDGSLALLP